MPDPNPAPTTPNPSRSRRLAREAAFQAVYMMTVGGAGSETALRTVFNRHHLAPETQAFVTLLVQGVANNRDSLDQAIEPRLAAGWTIPRLAVSDATAVRLALFELQHVPGIPPKVTISQAVELAKRFGTAESGGFVNGILGTLLAHTPKADWTPDQETPLPDLEPDEPAPKEQDPANSIQTNPKAIPAPSDKTSPWTIRAEEEDPEAAN